MFNMPTTFSPQLRSYFSCWRNCQRHSRVTRDVLLLPLLSTSSSLLWFGANCDVRLLLASDTIWLCRRYQFSSRQIFFLRTAQILHCALLFNVFLTQAFQGYRHPRKVLFLFKLVMTACEMLSCTTYHSLTVGRRWSKSSTRRFADFDEMATASTGPLLSRIWSNFCSVVTPRNCSGEWRKWVFASESNPIRLILCFMVLTDL